MYLLIPLGVTRRFILKGSVPEPFYKFLLISCLPHLLFPYFLRFFLALSTNTHALSYLILTNRPSPFSPFLLFPLLNLARILS